MSGNTKALTINIIQGNLVNVEAPAYVLGVFQEVAPKTAVLAVDRLLGGEIMEMYRSNGIDGSLGAVTSHATPTADVKADHIVFAGMGGIDKSRSRTLKRVGRSIVQHFGEIGESVVTTVPIGLGSGHSVENVVTYFIGGMIEAINDLGVESGVDVINICDFDTANCKALKQDLISLGETGVLSSFNHKINEASVPERPEVSSDKDVKGTPDPVYLQIRMGELIDRDAETIDVESTLMLPGNGATIDHRVKTVQAADLNALMASITNYADIDHALGQKFATMLLEPETVARIVNVQEKAAHPIILMHDQWASVVPWEVMSFPELPRPATKLHMSRRLIASKLPSPRTVAARQGEPLRVLLVVDPTEDLGGACREGKRTENLLDRYEEAEVTSLWQSKATREQVLSELSSGQYDVVHYAGHAFFDPANPGKSGIVCHKNEVLTGEDAITLEAFPRMIFLNACETSRIRRGRSGRHVVEATPALHVERGTGLAQAFLRGGVQHFLGTYWPVGDDAADAFSKDFYKRLIEGEMIGDAIVRARQAVLRIPSSDWADYIHYGDPTDQFR